MFLGETPGKGCMELCFSSFACRQIRSGYSFYFYWSSVKNRVNRNKCRIFGKIRGGAEIGLVTSCQSRRRRFLSRQKYPLTIGKYRLCLRPSNLPYVGMCICRPHAPSVNDYWLQLDIGGRQIELPTHLSSLIKFETDISILGLSLVPCLPR